MGVQEFCAGEAQHVTLGDETSEWRKGQMAHGGSVSRPGEDSRVYRGIRKRVVLRRQGLAFCLI